MVPEILGDLVVLEVPQILGDLVALFLDNLWVLNRLVLHHFPR